MTFGRILATTTATAALALAPLAPAVAQDGSATGSAPESGVQGGADMAVPDALLDSFVTAALSVSSVAEDYQGRMQAAETDAARQDLATEARQEMISAVEGTDGITVEEYVTIAEAAQTDESLALRLQAEVDRRSGAE
ncbi:DUF4168 domain-containing protein [Rhodovulum sp. 12E13]|uniref:DUF4168 domain-containing protein n=1 Tax=Rhodovulum sp. 12E13 TaxID=2203891 RepID=UPI000E14E681|nr:DUF4168 domain-containing protein [Rhodovulum sp. 12E13]RDC73344.1 DUF4168 domain-containing protein [Rhodovulum sp. 12E13]